MSHLKHLIPHLNKHLIPSPRFKKYQGDPTQITENLEASMCVETLHLRTPEVDKIDYYLAVILTIPTYKGTIQDAILYFAIIQANEQFENHHCNYKFTFEKRARISIRCLRLVRCVWLPKRIFNYPRVIHKFFCTCAIFQTAHQFLFSFSLPLHLPSHCSSKNDFFRCLIQFCAFGPAFTKVFLISQFLALKSLKHAAALFILHPRTF